jgi:ABC-2 type transport system ATP-binding protein
MSAKEEINGTVIQLNSLTRTFREVKAVNSLTLSIKAGEILGFLGPNGAGKTTTIRMMCGLLKPTSGEVLINGLPWEKASDQRLRIGYAPQENVFWPNLTCLEQLVFTSRMYGKGYKRSRTDSMDILGKLGLSEKSGKLASTLSGGMKRRLSLALSLVHDPEILILDEPEAGLDPQSRIMVREYIRSLKPEKTIILSTHNMDEADRLSDRIAVMDRGSLLMSDTPENLKKTVGDGDTLEAELHFEDPAKKQSLTGELGLMGFNLQTDGELFLIRGMDLVSRIADVSEKILQHGGKIGKLTLRENSLEDVFIHLTGRRLRS